LQARWNAHPECLEFLDLGLLLRQAPLDEAALVVGQLGAQKTAITSGILAMGDESD